METSIDRYWTLDAEKLADLLGCSLNGLSQEQATERLHRYGRNELRESIPLSRLRVLWRQLKNPVLLLLVFAAAASVGTGEWIDAAIVIDRCGERRCRLRASTARSPRPRRCGRR